MHRHRPQAAQIVLERERSGAHPARDPVEERAFPDWSMGFRRFGRADLDGVDGLNGFMSLRAEEPNAGAALRLLEIFRDTMR